MTINKNITKIYKMEPLASVKCQLLHVNCSRDGQWSMVATRYARGVSLLELLIYIALLSGILLVISSAFISISKTGGSVDARTEVNSNARFAANKMIQDIKSASAVSVPIAVGATDPTLELTVSGDTILYDVSIGQLRRKINAGTPEPITSSLVTVSAPIFTRLENYNSTLNATTTTININITITHANTGSDYNYSSAINTTASLR